MRDRQREYEVNGFMFRDEELYQKAKREVDGIKYIKNRTNMSEPKLVLQIYNKVLEQQLFETPVGIGYMRELQEYLLTNPAIMNDDVKPIPVEQMIGKDFVPVKEQKKEKSSDKFKISMVANIVLVIAIVGMFLITLSSRHPTILNYEEKLLNKYSSWEEELQEREKNVLRKEHDLGINP